VQDEVKQEDEVDQMKEYANFTGSVMHRKERFVICNEEYADCRQCWVVTSYK